MVQPGPTPKAGTEAASSWSFHPGHQAAVDRRRRIIVQNDAVGGEPSPLTMDAEDWKAFGFQYFDQPNSQVDSIWWDCGVIPGAMYPTALLASQGPAEKQAGLDWSKPIKDAGADWLAIFVEETHRRGLEVFWHFRISEVDIRPAGAPIDLPNPIKAAHPDWLIKTWWWQGMWNLAVPEVRAFKVAKVRELAERYDFDGFQIDFHRHIPVLPVGRQWELRDSVTEFMRQVRETLLEVSAAKDKPILLSAKVPRSLEVCRADGFDVVRWVQEGLVDMLTLGSRSYDVAIEGYRAALGPSVKLYPCLDDHHASDAYQHPPVEVFRGVASSWWRRGADGIETFNWYGAPPEVYAEYGVRGGPESQQTAYREIGSVETLNGKSKVFPVERRGGYPWAEGGSGQNLHAQLPLKLAYDGRPSDVTLYCAEDLKEAPEGKRDVSLRLTVFGSEPGDRLEVKLNGRLLSEGAFDYDWKDPKIFSPLPQPSSGGYGHREVDPEQRLLLVTCDVDPNNVTLGDNTVSISVTVQASPYRGRTTSSVTRQLQVEKVELHVIFEGEAV